MQGTDEQRRPSRKPSSLNRIGTILTNKTNLMRRRSVVDPNSMPVLTHDGEDDPFPTEGEEAPALRVRDVFSGLFHHNHDYNHDYSQGDQVDVEHYIHDKSIRRKMILLSLSNSKIGIRIHVLRFIFCCLGALFYIAETIHFDYILEEGTSFTLEEQAEANLTLAESIRKQIMTLVFLRDIPIAIWLLQIFDAFIIFLFACVILYVTESWSWRNLLKILDFSVFLMLVIPILYFITLLYPIKLKNLFVPSFLYIWPASQAFSAAVIQSMQRKYHGTPNNFKVKSIHLVIFLSSFIFTWTCVMHHFFRIDMKITLFNTYYFLLVTMSTVGYGDIQPRHWTGRLLVTIFIISALVYLIPLLEELYEAYHIQQKLHNSVSFTKAGHKHILICSTRLKPLVLRDFLTELYSDPNNYEAHCVVLVEHEMAETIQMYLSHPIWTKRITVLIGTPLRAADLLRARAQTAHACFIHTYRDHTDPHTADQHTIMSAWTIRDFAPECKLYVQILKPENKIHLLETADYILCEGELKQALLANDSHCPGISTLVTLILHTFKPESRGLESEDYQLYSKCAPCEIYDSRLGDSKYFHHFVGKNFLYTAVVAFRKYHVTLLAVTPAGSDEVKLNPGLDHIMNKDDICYFIGFSQEEYSRVGGATSIHHTLKDICANIAVVSMVTSGIDPMDFDEKKVTFGSTAEMPVTEEHVDFHPTKVSEKVPLEKVNFFIPQSSSDDSLHITSPTKPVGPPGEVVGEAIHEARRGLQLLRFHSRMDMHANPVVKYKLTSSHQDLHVPHVTSPTTTSTPRQSVTSMSSYHHSFKNEIEAAEHIKPDHHHHQVHPIHYLSDPHHQHPMEVDHVTLSMNDVPDTRPPPSYTRHRPQRLSLEHKQLSVPSDPPNIYVSSDSGAPVGPGNGFQRSYSDVFPAIPEEDEAPDSPHLLKTTALYSSTLSLIYSPNECKQSAEAAAEGSPSPNMRRYRFFHRPSVWSQMSVYSRNPLRMNSGLSSKPSDIEEDDVVELELDNLEEEEELEELEDGHCHDDDDDTEGTDSRETSPIKLSSADEEVPRPSPRKQRYEKGFLPISPYLGFEAPECHLVLHQRSVEQIHLIHDETTGSLKDELSRTISRGLVIVYIREFSKELYHFILPLRAHYLSAKSLKPLVIMFKEEPPAQCLETLTWLPLVYYSIGDLSCINDWLTAGISLADSVVILNHHSTLEHSKEELHEHMVDAAQIMATQKLAKLFPQVKILTEIHYRYNVRFMKTSSCEGVAMRNLKTFARKSDHLTYLFLPQFAAGRVFCSSMLDTLLFQNYMKPYMIEIVRQMLGCKDVQGSGFLGKMEMNDELMKLQTYDRVFQRLVSMHKNIPIGIYRTIPISECSDLHKEKNYSVLETSQSDADFLRARVTSLGLQDTLSFAKERTDEKFQSFVLPNPAPKTVMKHNDVILLLRCANTTSKIVPTHPVLHNPPKMEKRSAPNGTSLKPPERKCGFSVPVECYVTEC